MALPQSSPSLSLADARERAGPVIDDAQDRDRPNPFAAEALDFSLNRQYYAGDPSRPPLRIGVMMNDSRGELFMRKALEDVRDCDFAGVVCVIRNCTPEQAPRAPRPALQHAAAMLLDRERRRLLLYNSYLRWLDKRYRKTPDPRSVVDCSDLLEGASRVDVLPQRTRFIDRFPAAAIEELRSLRLDVVLRFGFRILHGEALSIARYGVWSFHHGDSERYRGGPALLWELMEGSELSGAVLQRLEETLDAGPILSRVNLASSPRPSVSANRYDVYWTAQHMLIQKLWELQRYGPEHLERRTIRPERYLGKHAVYRAPDNTQVARWLAPTFARSAARKLSGRGKIMHWRIGLRRLAQPLYEAPTSADRVSWIASPRGHFWADPFPLHDGAEEWLFFEDFDYRAKRGVIACGKIREGALHEVRTVLEARYHLSYPHVFRHAGEIWMIPESSEARSVQLFRARRFPDEWVLERSLLDLRAVDPTPFEFQGRWWMFVSPTVVQSQAPITLLFTAPEPWGPWRLHRDSPVCTDVRWARCAGAVICDGGRLLRPSQNCAKSYGCSICFNEVTVLSETQYIERHGPELVAQAFGMDGVHTYNRGEHWEAVDARAYAPKEQVL